MTAEPVESSGAALREVVVGRNSKVWRAAASNPLVARRYAIAIGHADLQTFAFTPRDRVWVFSYSRNPDDNSRMLARLAEAGVREVVYVSTVSTIVMARTGCYRYPRVKRAAEVEARSRLGARILTLGLVVDRLEQVPPGRIAVTLQSEIDRFLVEPRWPHDDGVRMRLVEMVAVPFARNWERVLHRAYDAVQWRLRGFPCLLRPLDLLLRVAGIRWYGYVNLSNRLWSTTTF
jgi:hypothetical protein